MASLVLAIFVSMPAAAQMDDRQAMMDLVASWKILEAVEAEVGDLAAG